MTSLHGYFILRNQQAFQRLLDTPTRSQSGHGAPGTSGGKSWTRSNPLSSLSMGAVDVNARDWLGRTVLHLAASATDASAPEYVRMLLAHPHINVNLPDKESHWTALHRALYHGNLSTALILLQRQDINVLVKDSEGYTAFDLYNSTVEGTKPRDEEDAKLRAELFTWGANRNAALGHGDADDRTLPDQITLEPAQPCTEGSHVDERFAPVQVRQVVMSKLHTGVVTTETKSNFRACGFGSGGRLGPGQHTQYSLVPTPQLPQPVASVALGQDHTLALTTSGEVFSWGLNRFSQLGYVLDVPTGGGSGRGEEPIQSVPRKIGALNRKVVLGVAACKTASACWTSVEVYTWGTNSGQLGYDKNAHPVQVLPRVVTRISQPVLSVAIADSALACLLESHDVLCLYNDSHFRVTFPAHGFPSEMKIYRPPQAVRSTSIQKIATCDNTFAALSSNGELFTFSLPMPSTDTTASASAAQGKGREVVKPQRVWALRKKFSAVKDVALGADGSIIICTESGHVFVRTRTTGKVSNKFQRVPYLQRVVRVCANSTGAFGALRVDADLQPIHVVGNLLPQDLALIQPYFQFDGDDAAGSFDVTAGPEETDVGEQEDSASIEKDRRDLKILCRVLQAHKAARDTGSDDGPFEEQESSAHHSLNRHGADLLIHVQSGTQPTIKIPAHCVVLAARSAVLSEVLGGRRTVDYRIGSVAIKMSLVVKQVKQTQTPPPSVPSSSGTGCPPPAAPWKYPRRLSLEGCHPLTTLILLVYLYTDEMLAIWDWRVAGSLKSFVASLGIDVQRVKSELQACALAFQLPFLGSALEAAFKRDVVRSLERDFLALGPAREGLTATATATDVLLVLADDKEVACHSAVLRARSPLFRALFDADVWTVRRWSVDGTIRLDFKHMEWDTVKYVLQFLYGGDREIFGTLECVKTVDELIELMIDVMAVANELLLDRLSLLCSAVILRRVTAANAASVLVDATHFNAPELVRSIQRYIVQGMETFLQRSQSHNMLDGMPADVVKQLSTFVRARQAEKAPLARSNRLVERAMRENKEWLEEQDFPGVVVHGHGHGHGHEGRQVGGRYPIGLGRRDRDQIPSSPSLVIRPQLSSAASSAAAALNVGQDEMFVMDGVESGPPAAGIQRSQSRTPRKDKESMEEGLGTEQKEKELATTPSKKGTIGWRVPSTPRVDMKSIMAEAQSSESPPLPPPPVPVGVRTSPSSSNWRAPPQLASSSDNSNSKRAILPPGSPWKSVVATPTSLASNSNLNPKPFLARTPPNAPILKATRSENDKLQSLSVNGSRQPLRAGTGSESSSSRPRQTSWKNTNTNGGGVGRTLNGNNNNAAWTLPPVQPVVVQSTSTSSSSGMSFVAIQQLQLEQEQDGSPKRRSLSRSLLEIQREEEDRRVEEEFLRWWAVEEARERTQSEQASVLTKSQKRSKAPRQHRKGNDAGKEGGLPLAKGVSQGTDGGDARARVKRKNKQQRPTASEGGNLSESRT
ncbi:hypothetical protein BC835DRAFT_1422860 [Cytidiella melzeri]|nr:hypothetical protein BC835DRAFT_1422860 [Cytidiella melzeri]